MEITKQQLFKLYSANENQRFTTSNRMADSLKLYGVTKDTVIWLWDGNDPTHDPVSDCQLILKPVSEMSEGHFKEFCKLLDYKETDDIEVLHEFIYKKDYEYCLMFKIEEVVSITIFLITHGYALSDEYFEKKWAVKERDVK